MVASDDRTTPQFSTGLLPVGAVFAETTNIAKLASGLFSWTPNVDQVGAYRIKFTAFDGELADSETVALTVVGTQPRPYPDWWIMRGVVNTNATATNDWVVANIGQVKHLASMAWDELNALPGGAGFTLSFTNTDGYAAVNTGQLKELATNFYARLLMPYPWIGATNVNDWAIANVGQVKNLFSFDARKDSDHDGLPDWWEQYYGGSPTGMDPYADSDNNGQCDLWEYLHPEGP